MKPANLSNALVSARRRVLKMIALILVLTVLAYPLQVSHAALAGDADLTFGSMGIVTTNFSGGNDGLWDLAIQPDGKIVSAGQTQDGFFLNFALTRHNADGSLDNTFGNGGASTTNFGMYDQALAVTIQPDGKILSAGRTDLGVEGFQQWKFALTRHNADGSLDTSFGNSGAVVTEMGGYRDEAEAVIVQPDGKIIVGGKVQLFGSLNVGLVRYNSDGSLDLSFGSGGRVIAPVGSHIAHYFGDILLRPDGKILVGAHTQPTVGVVDLMLMLFDSDGTLDESFGNNGVVTTDIAGRWDRAASVAIQQDGKIVLAGDSTEIGVAQQSVVVRYNSNGTIDSNFGTNGVVLTSFGGGYSARHVVIAADGKIVVCGDSYGGPRIAVAIARYNADGLLDWSFGSGGKMSTIMNPGPAAAVAFGLQSDGRFVVGGGYNFNGRTDFSLARFEGTSTPDALIGNATTLANSFNLPAGTATSLNSQLSNALTAFLAGDQAGACASLQSFINHVQAQSGKKIPESEAQQLLNAANEIVATIGCQ